MAQDLEAGDLSAYQTKIARAYLLNRPLEGEPRPSAAEIEKSLSLTIAKYFMLLGFSIFCLVTLYFVIFDLNGGIELFWAILEW
eukprot:CAMPEP_0168622100 /NCGR_PEP_ID=MMETSP0449_2-20121227/8071_1 /TAXON_ID=1082188 /ORGANISM="Strombidium rassoulzadegani, Strain ras09" /LENGTH=83 /DNA_ID=CAMNT_0008663311 /DNA_START=684 /DNA_END=932 /DNA_ORIENTATION=+